MHKFLEEAKGMSSCTASAMMLEKLVGEVLWMDKMFTKHQSAILLESVHLRMLLN